MRKNFSIETADSGVIGIITFNLLAYTLKPSIDSNLPILNKIPNLQDDNLAFYELNLYYKNEQTIQTITVPLIRLNEKTLKQAVEKLDSATASAMHDI